MASSPAIVATKSGLASESATLPAISDDTNARRDVQNLESVAPCIRSAHAADGDAATSADDDDDDECDDGADDGADDVDEAAIEHFDVRFHVPQCTHTAWADAHHFYLGRPLIAAVAHCVKAPLMMGIAARGRCEVRVTSGDASAGLELVVWCDCTDDGFIFLNRNDSTFGFQGASNKSPISANI